MIRRAYARLLLATSFAVALAACATKPPPTPAPTPEPVPASQSTAPAPSVLPVPPQLRDISVARAAFVSETAAKYGIAPLQIEAMLARAQIRDSIIAAMSKPAEAKPWRNYRPIFLTEQRITGGQAFLATHRDALAKVEAQYGVPAEIIVAILAVETNLGGNTGKYPVIDALYTLAFNYPRTGDPAKLARENAREAFFRDELGQLFALGKETGFDIGTLTGSYAGAMGWGQFMPSSYRAYAVDGNSDGKRDLFNSLDDVFASVANYFVQKGGWVRGAPVMANADFMPVSSTPGGNTPIELEGPPIHTLDALAQAGFKAREPLPAGITAAAIRLEGEGGDEYWLTFQNFRAIWMYNNSIRYATAVYQLAEEIAGRGPAVSPGPIPPPPVAAPAGQSGA
ncbi:lytic murein transglycosylase B [Lysobacter sp. CFH 32150]|uniref:lytic murein transglycosylase B n=1 Tax=Lysobacter sp. CFH 32150 TaxID=2927128 RepID=UPI001FA71BC6|nr:lytic murein transglycosylase B [Lysobacter sp. CFH 32150]MCI4568197.1 lytic murein transglycosylase B [Lysobacter sp. CFH 32150]